MWTFTQRNVPLWDILEPAWGPARDLRPSQPLMIADTPPGIESDVGVRRVRADEIEKLLPASIAMFTEEVGISPVAGDGGALYRSRVTELVQAGRSFARFDGDRVVFKAEVGAVTTAACQIQGVWVHPEWRGHGLGTSGTAALAAAVVASGRIASLYVNSYNTVARATYARIGFEQVGTFATILLD